MRSRLIRMSGYGLGLTIAILSIARHASAQFQVAAPEIDGATLARWREAQGSLLSPHYYVADTLILTIFAALGFRMQRASQMTRQYGWLYKKSSPLSWSHRGLAALQPQSTERP